MKKILGLERVDVLIYTNTQEGVFIGIFKWLPINEATPFMPQVDSVEQTSMKLRGNEGNSASDANSLLLPIIFRNVNIGKRMSRSNR